MMSPSILSDTNPLIYVLNGNQDIAEYLDGKRFLLFIIPGIICYYHQCLCLQQAT